MDGGVRTPLKRLSFPSKIATPKLKTPTVFFVCRTARARRGSTDEEHSRCLELRFRDRAWEGVTLERGTYPAVHLLEVPRDHRSATIKPGTGETATSAFAGTGPGARPERRVCSENPCVSPRRWCSVEIFVLWSLPCPPLLRQCPVYTTAVLQQYYSRTRLVMCSRESV